MSLSSNTVSRLSAGLADPTAGAEIATLLNNLAVPGAGALTPTAAEVNTLHGKAASVTITPAAGTANVCLATIQVLDATGAAIAVKEAIDVWLSDAATGATLTTTTASGAVAAGTAGVDLLVRTAKKETLSVTDATGKYILSITDSGKTGFYIAVLRGSQLTVSAQLVAGNYG